MIRLRLSMDHYRSSSSPMIPSQPGEIYRLSNLACCAVLLRELHKIRDLKLFFTVGSLRLGPFRALAFRECRKMPLKESLAKSLPDLAVARHYTRAQHV